MNNSETDLVPIRKIKNCLRYSIDNMPGAMEYSFTVPDVIEKLHKANNYLKQHNRNKEKIELLIWDSYRTKLTQETLFNKYKEELFKQDTSLSPQELYKKAEEFVTPPDSIFPHGTGGAVDVTLLINNKEAWMGTDFDEFTPESASDWYKNNPPITQQDTLAHKNRTLLKNAMESAGFIGIDTEWWHFEWGTITWSKVTDNPVILDKILTPPSVENSACADRLTPHRQPVLEYGVAQVFTTPKQRRDSLAHKRKGHYYARNSHPTIEALGNHIKNSIIRADHICFTESGLSSCTIAIKSLAPAGGTIVYDHKIYYEVESYLKYMAKQLHWKLIKSDFTSLKNLETIVNENKNIDIFFCDNPRNWWLDSLDIKSISSIAKKAKARLIVDISVQPLQDLLQEGADLVVLSLSKYPSTGLTIGGAILCNDPVYIKKCHTASTSEGHILSPEAASTIWSQIISLRDRMFALSIKTEKIASFLKGHPSVTKVRLPDKNLCGGFIGAQITFHLHNPIQCAMMEKIIGHNSLMSETSLHLACTFGASYTTFEHFASNIRHRELIPREETGEADIPDDIIRLGIGYENQYNIIRDLNFLLNITDNLCRNNKDHNKVHPPSFISLTLHEILLQERNYAKL